MRRRFRRMFSVLIGAMLLLEGCSSGKTQDKGIESQTEVTANNTDQESLEDAAAEASGMDVTTVSEEGSEEGALDSSAADTSQVALQDEIPQTDFDFVTVTGKHISEADGKRVGQSITPAREDELTILFAGDIIFEKYQNPGMNKVTDDDIRVCFDDETLSIMKNADLFVINNEFPYTDGGVKNTSKTFAFRCPTNSVKYLQQIGADVAALANNHIYDYGYEGVMDTFDTLDEASIPYIGAGRNLEDATKTAYFVQNGMAVAIVNATEIERYNNPDTKGAEEDSPGVFRCLDDTRLCEEVRKASEKADFVIAYVHWGTELQETPDGNERSIAQDLVDAGADLIVGAHPHILQNIEYIDDVPVFYSLGNFFFSASTRDNGVLQITLDCSTGKTKALQYIPMVQRQGVYIKEGSDKEKALQKMRNASPGVSIDEDGFFTKSEG